MSTSESAVGLRHELEQRLADARQRTDELFRIVRPEVLYERPIAERHRLIFYLGHLEAFDWNLIARRARDIPPFREEFDKLFAFGIDPTDGGLPNDQPSDWPSIPEVQRYVQQVRATIDGVLHDGTWGGDPILANGVGFQVAIEHRLMHGETLAYLLHRLPYARKNPARGLPQTPTQEVEFQTLRIPAGRATLGLERGTGAFGWDNEFDAHEVRVPMFAIDAYPVTNGQFLDFVRAGGYRESSLWSEEGWTWRMTQAIEHPGFWAPSGDTWQLRLMFQEIPLPLAWPVYVSHAEASAYARWRGRTLPTEAQFHRAAYGTPGGQERAYPWGDEEPRGRHGNFDFQRWDPTSVGAFPEGASAFGVHELVGNGWEWTSSPFEPFPGFEAFPFYAGYSANFFDGKHYVMKGGSARTAACMLRRSFRNWFQPHYPHVYAKFRCVES